MIEAQPNAGYRSRNDFREAFSRMVAAPTKFEKLTTLKAVWLDTPLGPMIAMANDDALYLLEFVERRELEKEIIHLQEKTQSAIIPGYSQPIRSIENELKQYFKNKLKKFNTPVSLLGSPFQKQVWKALKKIPYGETRSYLDIANAIDRPTASRAVARANGSNQLAIMIPCHRVINKNGNLGGYAGGLHRKEWLIQHEAK